MLNPVQFSWVLNLSILSFLICIYLKELWLERTEAINKEHTWPLGRAQQILDTIISWGRKQTKKKVKEVNTTKQFFAVWTKCYEENKGLRQVTTNVPPNAQAPHTAWHTQKGKKVWRASCWFGFPHKSPSRKMEIYPSYEKEQKMRQNFICGHFQGHNTTRMVSIIFKK